MWVSTRIASPFYGHSATTSKKTDHIGDARIYELLNSELLSILTEALAPCSSFGGVCAGEVTWDPAVGHVPRGYIGGLGSIQDIRLVLVTSEPGDVADGESVREGSPAEMVLACGETAGYMLEHLSLRRNGQPAPFHKKLRQILDSCWPNISFESQMKQTWVTPSMLCSAKVSGGNVPAVVTKQCATLYLARQLDILSHAFVIALGRNAAARIQQCERRFDYKIQHPSARPNTNPEATWSAAGESFQRWLQIN